MARPWSPELIPHRLDEAVLEVMLACWTRVNLLYLAEHPDLPGLYDYARAGRIRYIPDQLGVKEEWLGIPHILARGAADCKSLVCWRVAELRAIGEPAQPRIVRCGDVFHVYLMRADGSMEDPSTLLGMPYPNQWVW